ncbi:MAG: sugar ABC transporter permease [Sphaerochaeta sp.]|nr:sugar ABC transporter permease [Sphaerochaeta sp.]
MKNQQRVGYLFISPWIIGMLLFTIYPTVFSLYISFTEWPILREPKFIYFKNYLEIFQDEIFFTSLWVTTKFAIYTTFPTLAISLFIAILLNAKIKFRGILRTIYYLPAVLPTIAVALVWAFIFNKDYGLLNGFLRIFGITGPGWLADPNVALLSISIMSIWTLCSTNIILYLAGLQGVPKVYYEASRLDGANVVQQFFSITIPLISPIIFYTLVMSLITTFQVFTSAMMLTHGGPIDSTRFYVLYLYDTAFSYYKMGYASALAWILFIIILTLNYAVFKSSKMWVFYEGDE